MTKIFGAAVLVAAGLLIGRANAARCWDKAAAIHSLIEILELVRAGLQSRKRLSEICISPSGAEGYCGAFFRVLAKGLQASAEMGMTEIWEQSLTDVFGRVLSGSALAACRSVGTALAMGQGVDDAAQRSLRRLENLLRAAEERAERDGRLYTGVGMAMGAIVSIVLV